MPGLVEIEYDDIDDGFTDIAGDVIFRTAAFEGQLAAIPGMFEFTVRDIDQVYDFKTGREIRLTIDGQRYWGGYVTQVEMFYATIVDTEVPANVEVRQWQLRGVDYNILFDKRVLANYDNPTSGIPKFAVDTMDGDAITTLINTYLDTDDDGLSLAGIENVASLTPDDVKGAYGVPGEKWRQAMVRFANTTGSTWYINADKTVVNREREDETIAWGFSDKPDNVTTFGPQGIRHTVDGSSIVNDALIWGGSGFASGNVAFGRVENTASIERGLRMQYGATHFDKPGYFTNKSCRMHASVIVTGAPGTVAIVGDGPDSERGLQNAQQLLSLSWFYGMVPGPLTPGIVVTTTLYTFGAPKTITLPLRSVRISFLSPDIIRFDGSFGIQTADPYSLWQYMKRQAEEVKETQYIAPIADSAPEPVPGGTFNTNVTPTPDGTTTVFFLRFPYISASTRVTKDGLVLVRGTDYTESDPTTGEITLTVAPAEGVSIYATALAIGTGGTPVTPGVATHYISTSGNDSSGDGSLGNPWATLARFMNQADPGDTLAVLPGTYSGTGNRNYTISRSGTSEQPITVMAYDPDNRPVFQGGANGSSISDRFWLVASGPYSHFVFDGIVLANFAMIQNGVITLSNQASGGSIGDYTFRNCDIQQVAPADSSAQILYLGERFDDLLVQNCNFFGPHPSGLVNGGAAVSAYADDGPAPSNIRVENSTFTGNYTGYQLYSGATGSCINCVFTGCYTNIDLTDHGPVTVTGNSGEHGDSADIYDPTDYAYTTAYNNVFT